MDLKKKQLYGFDVYKNWHCKFPTEGLFIEGEQKKILMSEPRIDQLSKRLNLENMRILELGCLEGFHSLMLQMLGVKEVIAIEARRENFLKCLIVKNAFVLGKCRFLFGDLNSILPALSGHFDLCLALGILYHLMNPVSVIYRIAELAESIFVWTHYVSGDFPKGPLAEINYKGCVYYGKYVGEGIIRKHYLSGLEKRSFWMFERDLFKAVKDAGFRHIDLVGKEQHKYGPAMTFLAQK